jgi:hypothetical protein
MSYPTCFGSYDGTKTRCSIWCGSDMRCFLEYTRAKEAMYMNNNNKREETKEERKERLDREWEKGLPCYTCHPKMQRLCKHYNTFSRPDYNHEQFKIGKITCDDYIDDPAVPSPLMSVPVFNNGDPATPGNSGLVVPIPTGYMS